MRRRSVLLLTASSLSAGVAGCVDDSDEVDGADGTDDQQDSGTDDQQADGTDDQQDDGGDEQADTGAEDDESETEADEEFTITDPWPTYAFDWGNTSYNINARGPADAPGEIWRFSADGAFRRPPVAVEDTVFAVARDDALYAFDVTSGTIRWERPVNGESVTPTVANGIVLYGDEEGLYALDTATGAEQWTRTDDDGWFGSPLVVNGDVYANTTTGTFYALDEQTGETHWTVSDTTLTTTNPAYADGTLYLSQGSQLRTVDTTEAAPERRELFDASETLHPATVRGDNVYLTTRGGTVFALDRDGTERWQTSLGDDVAVSPTTDGKRLFVATESGTVYSLDPDDGSEDWTTNLGDEVFGELALSVQDVYVAAGAYVYALSALTGEESWSIETGFAESHGGPVVTEASLFVGGDWFSESFAVFR